MKPPRYAIAAVSRLTGTPVDTLRAWERRYRAVEPARDRRGRLYSAADVERLQLLRRAVDAGHAIGRVAALPTDELRRLVADTEAHAPRPASPDLGVLAGAVGDLDAGGFRRELSRLAAALPVRALCCEVALPLLRLVGDAWHAGRLSIAQEHLVSAEIRSLLGALARLREVPAGAPRLVLGTPAGELHEFGALSAAVLAADAGFGALYLGPDVPAAEVVSAATRARAAAVVLGWTGGARDGAVSQARAALQEIARALPDGVGLWVGGAGAREAARVTSGRATALLDLDAYDAALRRLGVAAGSVAPAPTR